MKHPKAVRFTVPILAVLVASACGDDTSIPEIGLRQMAGPEPLTAVVEVSNLSDRDIGPIDLAADEVRFAGSRVPGVTGRVLPAEIPTLAGGSSVEVRVELDATQLGSPGTYRVRVEALAAGTNTSLDVDLELPATGPAASSLTIGAPASVRQGDVAAITVDARDASGAPLDPDVVSWRVEPSGAGVAMDARFVAYQTGDVQVIGTSGAVVDSVTVSVTARNAPGVGFAVTGVGAVTDRFTSDLWVRGDYAYTGTWSVRSNGSTALPGNVLQVWDVSDPASPARVDQLTIDARTLNDVKLSADGSLAAISHEASNDGQNGVTILDLADPAHPTPITRYTQGLASGVHNLWIDGDHLYVAVDGVGRGLRILDISDPTAPSELASFWAGDSFLHDVYVRDGLAFLSHWNAGLVILDVGNGIAGGSPSAPVEVSRVQAGGQTHNAWYWPDAGYVFVGEEDFGTPGRMHVIDVSDLWHPVEVASYAVQDVTPHNFWLDEDRGILYAAWYERGIRAVDVSGELLGELERQGRELGSAIYAGQGEGCPGGTTTCTWAPQLDGGRLYVSDMNSGLYVLSPTFQ